VGSRPEGGRGRVVLAPGFCYFLGVRTPAIFAFLILSVLGILAVLWANRLFRFHRQAFSWPTPCISVLERPCPGPGHPIYPGKRFPGRRRFGLSGDGSLALYILLMGLSLYFLTVAAAGFANERPPSPFASATWPHGGRGWRLGRPSRPRGCALAGSVDRAPLLLTAY